MQKISLKKHEENRLLSGHLWIYSNEVDVQKTPLKQFEPGELVVVENSEGKSLGIAYINPGVLLCGRILFRDDQQIIDESFFVQKIQTALDLRNRIFDKPFYRLIYGESDELPGLIIDRFDDYLVIQMNTAGMEKLKTMVVDACISLLKPKGILLKNDTSSRELEGLEKKVEIVCGTFPEEVFLEENKVKFVVPVMSGQKTGWFYDHRFNRQRLNQYVKGKRVLDLFGYVGGWGIQSAVYGAKEVVCVDSSQLAVDYVVKNAELNQVVNRVSSVKADVFDYLNKLISDQEKFDVIIVDPPAFIKRAKDIPAGTKAYQRLNALVLQLLNPHGLLASSSCSMHFSREMLMEVIRKSGVFSHRHLRIIEQFHQAQDHPIHPAIKETDYLKGFLVG